jgi:hypothetical protein
VTEFQDDWPG